MYVILKYVFTALKLSFLEFDIESSCIVIYSYYINQKMHYFSNLFRYNTLYVSDISTLHHQVSQHCIQSNR